MSKEIKKFESGQSSDFHYRRRLFRIFIVSVDRRVRRCHRLFRSLGHCSWHFLRGSAGLWLGCVLDLLLILEALLCKGEDESIHFNGEREREDRRGRENNALVSVSVRSWTTACCLGGAAAEGARAATGAAAAVVVARADWLGFCCSAQQRRKAECIRNTKG